MRSFSLKAQFILVLFICLTVNSSAQDKVKVYAKFKTFEAEHLQQLDTNKTYVINFWATWCVPCVKELPYFEALQNKYKDKDVEILLVSLDLVSQMESKLIPFIKKNKLNTQVVLLTDGQVNNWIDLIDPSWSGAIPATLVIKGGQRIFYEKQYHSLAELEKDVINI